MSLVEIYVVMSYEVMRICKLNSLIMSYEYEGAHNYETPHNAKTHNRGEPCLVGEKLSRGIIILFIASYKL